MKTYSLKSLWLPCLLLLAAGCKKTAHTPPTPFINTYSLKWQKTYGGMNAEHGNALAATADGGTVVTGYSNDIDGDVTSNHGGNDIWVVKLNANGAIDWQKSIGGTDEEEGTGVAVMANGDIVVVGYGYSEDDDLSSSHGSADAVVTRLDPGGNIRWTKLLGGSQNDYALGVALSNDGIFVTGNSNSTSGDVSGHVGGYDAWVAKLDYNGGLKWMNALGGSSDDGGAGIAMTADGGVAICGYTSSNDGSVTGNHGDLDMWVAKLNGSGSLAWQKCMGGTAYEEGLGITVTSDKGIVVTGHGESTDGDMTGNHGANDIIVAKLDETGNLQWKKLLGGSDYDFTASIVETPDRGLALVGGVYSNNGDLNDNHGEEDVWVAKLDNTGSLKWQKNFGGSSWDYGFSIVALPNGELRLTGVTYSDNIDVTSNYGDADVWVVRLQPQ